jgi:hypothetical protein
MESDLWARRVYYALVLGVGAFGLVVGIAAKKWWGTPGGWVLLVLWVLCAAGVLYLALRRDQIQREGAR